MNRSLHKLSPYNAQSNKKTSYLNILTSPAKQGILHTTYKSYFSTSEISSHINRMLIML
jgi:hypothetical protein